MTLITYVNTQLSNALSLPQKPFDECSPSINVENTILCNTTTESEPPKEIGNSYITENIVETFAAQPRTTVSDFYPLGSPCHSPSRNICSLLVSINNKKKGELENICIINLIIDYSD